MGVISITTDVAGQTGNLIGGVAPRRVAIISTDNLATVTTAGYLNQEVLEGYTIYPTDTIDMWYGAKITTGPLISNPGTYEVFTPSIVNGVITLLAYISTGNVLLPVVAGDFAVFNGTTGQIKDSAQKPTNAASPYLVTSPGAVVVGDLPSFADVNGTLADTGILAANIMQLNVVNTMSAAGQIILSKVNGTEATNLVTASGNAGVITTSALTTAGGGSYVITWTNTKITTTSTILLTIMGGTNTTENITLKATAGAGTSTLTIYNTSTATPFNGTILIGYAVL
jgi:hypothetical protein